MKKVITILFILFILLPMLVYLNPFIWGMRRQPQYNPSLKTERLMENLNQKFNIKMEVGNVIDTLWYFRDVENQKKEQLENFELRIYDENATDLKSLKIEDYVTEFNANFEHKNYFDSIKVVVDYDSIIYSTKIK